MEHALPFMRGIVKRHDPSKLSEAIERVEELLILTKKKEGLLRELRNTLIRQLLRENEGTLG